MKVKIIESIFIILFVLLFVLFLKMVVMTTYTDGFQQKECHIFIYDNSTTTTRTKNLEILLSKLNYPYKIVGKGEEWKGWYGRWNTYIDEINKIEDKDAYVCLLDGRDVLITQPYSEFIKKATNQYEDKIIVGAEEHCCNIGNEFENRENDKERHNYVNDIKTYFQNINPDKSNKYHYVNFGTLFGKCKDFIQINEIMNMRPGYDDQGTFIQRIMEKKIQNYQLDYKHNIFSVLFELPKWDKETQNYYNEHTNTFPSIFHFPAKTGIYVDCAKGLFKKWEIDENLFVD